MKKTLGDRLINFYSDYLAVTKTKIGKKEKNLLSPEMYDSVLEKSGYEKLTPEKRRNVALQCPLLMKGIKKKSLDTFRAWFKIETEDGKSSPIKADIDAFKEFETRNQLKKKMYEMRLCAHIYGDGFLLITFLNDEHKSLSDPVDETSEPYIVDVLNPEHIKDMKKVNGTIYYSYDDGSPGEAKLIHPDRIIHATIDKLPHSMFGISTIDIVRWTLESNKNIDRASGQILSWFAHGILDITKEGLQDPERDGILKVAAKHPGAWVHDEEMTIEYKNPTAINPKPFYDYVVLNIAAVLNMPTHVLTGIQTGRVTGSEIGFADYYRDVRDEQQLIFEPLLVDLYSRILRAKGRRFKYILKWNEIYVDEGMEVEQLVKKIDAAEKALTGGFITKQEARKILNDGQIVVDPEDVSQLKDTDKEPPFDREPTKPKEKKPKLAESDEEE